ncbi:unnamed protein product [Phaedon cochleariae]|uniref:FAS1 domain-containing protein n=1 Tax=Phaedon cochleariae TaxID=80249 RepID=A0A9N9X189_PHACE|nr:unnamed protein product [Phaedon cochleariae]
MMVHFLASIILCLFLVINHHVSCQRSKTVYQKIQQEPQFAEFNALVRSNRVARLNLHFEQLTVFVPENRAFRDLQGDLNSNLAFYHMSFDVYPLDSLGKKNSLSSVNLENPPLWITRVDEDVYVNNAKILQDKSNYVSRSRDGYMGKQQVLHMIDEVLDPVIPSPKYSPTAYDFLSTTVDWRLQASLSVSNFFTKVKENKLQHVYEQNIGHTFFVPLDSGMDPHKFRMMDKHIVLGHVIPSHVLFTRPTRKNFPYESLTNDDYAYIVLSFTEREGKLFVKGLARGSYGEGQFYSEVVVPNIPVKNGVVHLIAQPLGIVNRALRPFPYLPILEKLSTDPSLEVVYTMGERTGFNKIFSRKNVSFTYLVSRDSSWKKLEEGGLDPMEKDLDMLKRHLIISQTPYSVEQLYSLTKANNYTGIDLRTEAGPLRIMVVKIDQDYYLRWYTRYIKFLRADYECTDGIIHVLSSPLANFRKKDEISTVALRTDYKGYWETFKHAFFKILNVWN